MRSMSGRAFGGGATGGPSALGTIESPGSSVPHPNSYPPQFVPPCSFVKKVFFTLTYLRIKTHIL